MQVHTFTADSAAQAVEQIRQQLGPQAVVLNVRKLPAEGLARLWQKPRIEVLACVPEAAAPAEPAPDVLAELRQELAQIKEQVQQRSFSAAPNSSAARPFEPPSAKLDTRVPTRPAGETETAGAPDSNRACAPVEQPGRPDWNRALREQGRGDGSPSLARLLESSGLLPLHAQQILDEMRTAAGGRPPESLAEELRLVRVALLRCWRPQQAPVSNCHIFIGPPGVGKTTVLCKWLAQAVLVEGRRARVWRLDGHVANTAESLSVFAEILGVPVERFRPEAAVIDPSEMVFVDLPGVNWNEAAALQELAHRLGTFPSAEVHLVLNAAYESQLLLAQAHAYNSLPVQDLILTHLDEEPRWGKLWNLLLGSNFTLGYLSAGQNIPGEFHRADPEAILGRQFSQK